MFGEAADNGIDGLFQNGLRFELVGGRSGGRRRGDGSAAFQRRVVVVVVVVVMMVDSLGRRSAGRRSGWRFTRILHPFRTVDDSVAAIVTSVATRSSNWPSRLMMLHHGFSLSFFIFKKPFSNETKKGAKKQ